MIDHDESRPYTVRPEDARFKVLDAHGHTILVCGDATSAEQYAVLMNQAYRSGFNAGYRKARG